MGMACETGPLSHAGKTGHRYSARPIGRPKAEGCQQPPRIQLSAATCEVSMMESPAKKLRQQLAILAAQQGDPKAPASGTLLARRQRLHEELAHANSGEHSSLAGATAQQADARRQRRRLRFAPIVVRDSPRHSNR